MDPLPESDVGRDVGMDAVIACWSCHGPVAPGVPFCPICNAVQAPGQVDHFGRLGLATGFDVDTDALDQSYFALQRRLHPDRFVTRTARERALSQQQATSLNEAYETLKDPLRRADYLMELEGVYRLPEDCTLVDEQELLMEAMERREALGEASTAAEVEKLARTTAGDIDACVVALSAAFAGRDVGSLGHLVTRLKYLRKLALETRARKARLAG